MPLFMCERCGTVENTALSNYWTRDRDEAFNRITPAPPALCSACDPEIGHWHGEFERRVATGMFRDADGHLHDRQEYRRLPSDWIEITSVPSSPAPPPVDQQ